MSIPPIPCVVGAILAGGKSRRMGADKVRLRVGGRAVLPGLAELLASRLAEVWVVGRTPEVLGLPAFVRWQQDLRPGQGPLGGIATALRVAGGRAVLAVACDMPLLGGELIDFLLAGRRAEAPASVPRNPATGMLEPLCALYEPGALASIERAISEGKLSASRWLESAGAHILDLPADLACQLSNINTPEDLAEMEHGT
jgi:molybdopterin-guanine dinucleotide biosynthesis protein A